MANITISDLRPAGSELFSDSESYLKELSEGELATMGGSEYWYTVYYSGQWTETQVYYA